MPTKDIFDNDKFSADALELRDFKFIKTFTIKEFKDFFNLGPIEVRIDPINGHLFFTADNIKGLVAIKDIVTKHQLNPRISIVVDNLGTLYYMLHEASDIPHITIANEIKSNSIMEINDLLHHTIGSDKVLLFDLDGTLIDTDNANNAAYTLAIQQTINKKKEDCTNLAHIKRITKEQIATIPDITQDQITQIIECKKRVYRYQINRGNSSPYITYQILQQYSKRNNCYIITSADRSRAEQIVAFYQLNNYAKDIIYTTCDSKYDNICEKVGANASNIILFENEQSAIEQAIQNGINPNQIVFVKENLLKFHKIIADERYLNKTTIGYYSLDYVGYQHWNNPDFINHLKNQFNNTPLEKLQNALKELTKTLIRDISYIYSLTKVQHLTVIGIPRAKAENTYTPNQLLFKQGIRNAINELIQKGLNLEDGTNYILRHTDTKTTHLARTGIQNDGNLPYPGITKDTCNIDQRVSGKDILLIDDIYTKTINIDEDAIQALYDNGAKSVVFYSVCKTV